MEIWDLSMVWAKAPVIIIILPLFMNWIESYIPPQAKNLLQWKEEIHLTNLHHQNTSEAAW